jgi:hypothetical protein
MSLAMPKTLSNLLEVTRVQDTTFTVDASLSGRIDLAAVEVGRTLKDSIELGRKILGLGGEVKRMGMS